MWIAKRCSHKRILTNSRAADNNLKILEILVTNLVDRLVSNLVDYYK